MPKNVLHDIMTKEERSIRRVPLPHSRKAEQGEEESALLYEREEFAVEESSPFSWGRIFLWGAACVFLILLGLALSTSFTGVTITITPKTELISVNHEFTASRDAAAKLLFQPVLIRETAETTIPADTTKKVVQKASGTVVVYNNFSDKPQRLIKNTRFETADGLIYRISQSITVPGKTVKNGRTIPGSVEAVVYANSSGKEYNIPLSDFTIPGFKSDKARFAGFYARSKTAMTGGFDGTVKIPSDEALTKARAALRADLDKRIAKKLQSAVPEGFILFDGARAVKNESAAPEERGAALATVRETATGAVYLFKREDLARAIAEAAFPAYTAGAPVEVPELDTLVFRLKDPIGDTPAQTDTIRFTISGAARAVWLYDETKLRNALAGRPKSELALILASFPTIERVDLIMRPFWSRSFPKNPKKVSFERAELNPPPAKPPMR